jgi:hypothetical protein
LAGLAAAGMQRFYIQVADDDHATIDRALERLRG